MLHINVAQVKALYEDVKDLPAQTPLELHAVGATDTQDKTIELIIPSKDEGDFLFENGTTGY